MRGAARRPRGRGRGLRSGALRLGLRLGLGVGLLGVVGCGAEPGTSRRDAGPRDAVARNPDMQSVDAGDSGPGAAADATVLDATVPDATVPDATVPDATTPAPRYLALGDSYTIGESVDPQRRFPEGLVARLAAGGQPLAAPEIIARTGWATAQLAAAVAQANPSGPYPLVTLLVGVNDQFRGGRVADFEPAFRGMLATAVTLAGAPCGVVVISIPDYGQTPFGSFDAPRIAAGIDAFNAVARSEATRVGAPWVDITDISRRGLAEPALVARDGLHPSAEQYAEWVERIAPVALHALRTCAR